VYCTSHSSCWTIHYWCTVLVTHLVGPYTTGVLH